MLLLTVVGCAATSPCGRPIGPTSPLAEALAGDRAAPALEARFGGIVRDAAAEQRMERVLRRLLGPDHPLACAPLCRLLNASRPNAVSLPTARVYITRGLYTLLDCDDCLAAVLAHELAHLDTKDHFLPAGPDPRAALQREQAADRRGRHYLEAAGYRPSAMAEVVALVADHQPAGWADARVAALAPPPLSDNASLCSH